MPKYNYIAKNKKAQNIKDMEFATSKAELVAKLRNRGLFIISIAEIDEAAGSRLSMNLFGGKSGKRNSIQLTDLTFLARNLATTLSSGVTLLRSLEILASQTSSGKLQEILVKSSDSIKSGLSLSEAIAKYPRVFNNLWRGIIEVGEASGNLPFVLEKLAEYLEMRMEFERKIKSAMVYPIILMSAAVGVLTLFFKVILPKFVTIFTQFNIDLPLPTKIIFGISQIFEQYFLVIVVGVAGAVFGLIYAFKQPDTKRWWDTICLKLPVVGNTFTLMAVERFTSTIHILLESGLPLVYTLETAAKSIDNSYLEKVLFGVKERVKEGSSLSEELAKTGAFPLMIPEMAKIGEETGTLPEVFKKISAYYQKELTARIERFVAAFEPMMIVVMGIIVGGLVISLFLPMFKISAMK